MKKHPMHKSEVQVGITGCTCSVRAEEFSIGGYYSEGLVFDSLEEARSARDTLIRDQKVVSAAHPRPWTLKPGTVVTVNPLLLESRVHS